MLEVSDEALLELGVLRVIKLVHGSEGHVFHLSQVDVQNSPGMIQLRGCICLHGSGMRA